MADFELMLTIVGATMFAAAGVIVLAVVIVNAWQFYREKGCEVAKPKKWLEMVKGTNGKWHYRFVSRNGEITATSQQYATKSNCKRAITKKANELNLPIV